MVRFLTTLFLVLHLFVCALSAQNENVEWYHQEDGLPNDLIKSFAKDSAGFIWVATDDGLVKIEGRRFIDVSTPKMFSNNFKNILFSKKYGLITTADPGILKVEQTYSGINSIYLKDALGINEWPNLVYPKTLFEANDSSIWVADLQNIYRVVDNKIITYAFPPKNYTDHFSRSYLFFEVSNNQLFVLSETGYLYRFNDESDSFIEVPWNYFGTHVHAVEKVNDYSWLIGTEDGILLIDFDKNGFLKNIKDLEFEHSVSIIKRIEENKYVFGTWRSGAYSLIFKDGEAIIKFLHDSENQTINDIVIDNQKQIWLGTNLGIIVYRKTVFDEPFRSITQSYIQDVREGENSTIFFSDGNTVFRVDDSCNISPFYTPKNSMVMNLDVCNRGVWMGTNTGLLVYKKFDGVIKEYDFSNFGKGIYNLVIDKELNTWIIQERPEKETLLRIDKFGEVKDLTPKFMANNQVRSLHKSPKGELFIGGAGNDNYLFKYNYATEKIENLSISVDAGLNSPMSVNDIEFIDDNNYLLATKYGIWKLGDNKIVQFDLGDMTNEMVTGLVFDKEMRLWFANSNGIIKYENSKTIVFDNADGLPAKTLHYRCLLVDLHDNLWAGTISGIAKGKIKFDQEKTQQPIISSFEKSGVPININDDNRFEQRNMLSLIFATPVYPAKYVKYQYSLSNDNDVDNWIELPGYEDNLILANLQQGSYYMKIRARNKGHLNWSDSSNYQFKIYKVWYTRVEILAIIYLIVFIFIWLYIRYSRKKGKKEKIRLEKVIEHRTLNLKDQNEKLKQLNNNLRVAKAQSEAAIKTKDRFFSILAHDLKSPFNTLIGFSQLLVHNRNDISEESLEELFVEMLKISENTYKLLENLLDWALSQTGAMQIDKKQIIFNDLLTDILPTLEAAAKQKEIVINIDIQKSLSVFADEAIIGTVFRNLISNAIKFSGVKSSISIKAISKNGFAEIRVEDKGVGISEDKQKKIFAIDANVSTPGTANEIGTGLGLVLCKEFVKKSNGTISVESVLNEGSVFIVNIPLK